jgi:hypothetical protein
MIWPSFLFGVFPFGVADCLITVLHQLREGIATPPLKPGVQSRAEWSKVCVSPLTFKSFLYLSSADRLYSMPQKMCADLLCHALGARKYHIVLVCGIFVNPSVC